MNDKHINRLLSRIEKECQDDLKLVYQLDVNYFDTEFLESLYEKWLEHRKQVYHQYKYLIGLVAIAPVFLLIGGIGNWLDNNFFATFIFGFPIFLLVFLIGMLIQNKKYGSLKQYEHTGKIVRSELQRRYNKMYI
jgi:hypothetical protein